jgi:excinuclease ABC subunit B
VETAKAGEKNQVLLGVTGSGKTFTMAKVIEELQRPALILAPNKIWRRSFMANSKAFFPTMPSNILSAIMTITNPRPMCRGSDTYIEKESSVNEAIDRMRHSATRVAPRTRRRDYRRVGVVPVRHRIGRDLFSDDFRPQKRARMSINREIDPQARRAPVQAQRYRLYARGNFRVRGDNLEIFPSHYEDMAWRISFFGDEIEEITEFDPLTGTKIVDAEPCAHLCQQPLCHARPDAQAGVARRSNMS